MKRLASTLSARMSSSTRKVGVFSAVVLVFTSVIALASIPDSFGVINGCYGVNGLLRVVNSSAECRNGETAINWNQAGPKGDPGEPGSSVNAHTMTAFAVDLELTQFDRRRVTSLSLPAGKYVVNASVHSKITVPSGTFVSCNMLAGTTYVADSVEFGFNNQSVSMIAPLELSEPADLVINCSGANAIAEKASVSAIQVGSLNAQFQIGPPN